MEEVDIVVVVDTLMVVVVQVEVVAVDHIVARAHPTITADLVVRVGVQAVL